MVSGGLARVGHSPHTTSAPALSPAPSPALSPTFPLTSAADPVSASASASPTYCVVF